MTEANNKELQLKHLFDGGAWNVYTPDILNLGVGAPGTDLLEPCCEIFQHATNHCLVSSFISNYIYYQCHQITNFVPKQKREKAENQSLIFQYGPTSGTYEVRNEIAKYFSQMYNSPVNR